MSWISPWRLSKIGMLGINCRNRDFIGRYNPRHLFPQVDDKLKTKLLAQRHKLATPSLRFVVREQHSINRIEQQLHDLEGFVLKPAKGAGGRGILVIIGRHGDRFIKASGAEITIEDIRRHMTNTLAGLYSLGGTPDVVLVEDLIEFDQVFDGYSHEGVPDIRIVVFKGYPVMAMLRLATRASDGKANLHQGAVGVGLDIGKGQSLNAVQFNRPITLHPDTGLALENIRIDDWENMLEMAARCYEATNLGYMGVDLVVDAHQGPLLLELNARPGLAIQMANGCGLLPRLKNIEALKRPHFSPRERVHYAMETFGKL